MEVPFWFGYVKLQFQLLFTINMLLLNMFNCISIYVDLNYYE